MQAYFCVPKQGLTISPQREKGFGGLAGDASAGRVEEGLSS